MMIAADNPFSISIQVHRDFTRVAQLYSAGDLVSATFLGLINLFIILASVLLWPYGQFYKLSIRAMHAMQRSVLLLEASSTPAEWIAHGFALLLIYIPIFLILFAFTSPLYGLWWVSRKISADPSLIGKSFGVILGISVVAMLIAAVVGLVVAFVIYVVLPVLAVLAVVSVIGAIAGSK